MLIRIYFAIAALITFGADGALGATTERLTLQDYLGQVRQKHSGLKAASEASQGASLRSEEGSLLLAPTLFGSAQYINDEQPRLSPALQGNKSTLYGYSLGVSKQTDFGLRAALSYNINHTSVFGANPAFTPLPEYYDAKPMLELSFPLWRNLFGGETKADQERLEAQALATSFDQSFRLKTILADAETAYWRLAVAKAAVDIQQERLNRAQTIRDWLSKQVRLQLSDEADLLQATAAVRVAELDLAAATDDARISATTFNSLRGIEATTVDAALSELESAKLLKAESPDRAELRDDVKAAQQRQRLASAVATLGLERASPTFELFSTLALNGRDALWSESASESFSKEHPYAVVGVRFSAPLDLPTTFDTRAGYRREKVAAELDYDRRVFEQQQEWVDLTRRLAEAKSRLKLATEIVTAQKQKLEHERLRRRRGRTTTYQVLLFEQDYAAAELSRLRTQANIVDVIARMKTFGGDSR